MSDKRTAKDAEGGGRQNVLWDDDSLDIDKLIAEGVFDVEYKIEENKSDETSADVAAGDTSTCPSLSKLPEGKAGPSKSEAKRPGPVCSSQAHTMEWLRNQLEKLSKECSSLKEDLSTKDGESKILREKLNEAELTMSKTLLKQEAEKMSIKDELDQKIKTLEKELQNTRTQLLFKTKEAESHIEKYTELKKLNVLEPHQSQPIGLSKSKTELGQKITSRQWIGHLESYKDIPVSTSVNPGGGGELATTVSLSQNVNIITKSKGESHLGKELEFLTDSLLFIPPKPENGFLVPPPIDYYPFNILYKDVSEIPTSDGTSSESNLERIWNINPTKSNPKSNIKYSKKHFTTLEEIYPELRKLFTLGQWNGSSIPDFILEHVTKMALDLYYALRETPDTSVDSKETEIMNACLNSSELNEEYHFYSPEKKKNEIYVDLRRGLTLLSTMCDLDQAISKSILQKSRFMEDDQRINNYLCLNKIPSSTRRYFDNDLNLTTSMQMLLKIFETNNDWADIHIRDSFRNGTLEVGELAMLMHRYLPEQLLMWGKAVNKFQRDNDAEAVINDQISKLVKTANSERENIISVVDSSSDEEASNNYSPSSSEVIRDINFDSHLKERQNLLASEACDYWKRVLDDPSSVIEQSTTHKSIKTSFIHSLLKKEETKWESTFSSEAPSVNVSDDISLDTLSSPHCISKKEFDLLGAAYHNFLKMKSSVSDVEISCICQFTEDKTNVCRHGVHIIPKKFELAKKKKKKRRFSDDKGVIIEPESQPGTSTSIAASSSSIRQHDVAPLKKYCDGSVVKTSIEDDYKELEAEVEKMYSKKERSPSHSKKERSPSHSKKERSPSHSKKERSPKLKRLSKGDAKLSNTFKSPMYPTKKHDLAPLKKKGDGPGSSQSVQDVYKEIEAEVDKMFDGKNTEKSEENLTNLNKKDKDSFKSNVQAETQLCKEDNISVEIDASEYGLLQLVTEIAKHVGIKKYTTHFNPIFAAATNLLHSCIRDNTMGMYIRQEKILTFILEILYCRPSPIVVRNINKLLVRCLPIDGFAKIVCHNAHPNKFSYTNDRVTFKRGSCLLSTICSIVEISINEDNWEVQLLLFRWLSYLFFIERATIENLYEFQNTPTSRCHCVRSLNINIIKILAKAAMNYYRCCKKNKLRKTLKFQLTEIIEHGIRMISVIIEIDHCFSSNSHNQYNNFILFLQTVLYMQQENNRDKFQISLQAHDMKIMKTLLEDEVVGQLVNQPNLFWDESLNLEIADTLSSVQIGSLENMFSKHLNLEKD